MNIEFVKGAAAWHHLPEDGRPEVAFVGRSNVGKSSLLNMVAGRKQLARTSGTPSKTQELNYYLVDDAYYLVDLPGYGYAKISKVQRAKWTALIGRYVSERETLRGVFHLIDSRHPPTELDRDLFEALKLSEPVHIVVLTKADKLSGNKRQQSVATVKRALKEFDLDLPIVVTSSSKRQGRDELLKWMKLLT